MRSVLFNTDVSLVQYLLEVEVNFSSLDGSLWWFDCERGWTDKGGGGKKEIEAGFCA